MLTKYITSPLWVCQSIRQSVCTCNYLEKVATNGLAGVPTPMTYADLVRSLNVSWQSWTFQNVAAVVAGCSLLPQKLIAFSAFTKLSLLTRLARDRHDSDTTVEWLTFEAMKYEAYNQRLHKPRSSNKIKQIVVGGRAFVDSSHKSNDLPADGLTAF